MDDHSRSRSNTIRGASKRRAPNYEQDRGDTDDAEKAEPLKNAARSWRSEACNIAFSNIVRLSGGRRFERCPSLKANVHAYASWLFFRRQLKVRRGVSRAIVDRDCPKQSLRNCNDLDDLARSLLDGTNGIHPNLQQRFGTKTLLQPQPCPALPSF